MGKTVFYIVVAIVAAWLASCIPENGGADHAFEIRPAKIIKITTTFNDTVALGAQTVAGLWYKSGSEDCYEYYDSSFVKSDSFFYAGVREKVYVRRLCFETSITRIQSMMLPNNLPAGSYQIIANEGTADSLVYRFWVR